MLLFTVAAALATGHSCFFFVSMRPQRSASVLKRERQMRAVRLSTWVYVDALFPQTFVNVSAFFKERQIFVCFYIFFQVKHIMEEAVMLKSIHEESSTVTALCSAVDSCLSLGEWSCFPKN